MKPQSLLLKSLIVFCIYYPAILFSQTPCDFWGLSNGNQGSDIGLDIAKDADGFIYLTGEFSGTVNFSNGYQLVSAGGTDIFVAKYDSLGNNIWAVRAGGNLNDRAQEIVVDSEGNTVISGDFSGTAYFGSTILFSFGGVDAFICKISPAGNILWAKGFGGTDLDNGRSVAVNQQNQIVLLSFFTGTAHYGSYQLTSAGVEDIALVKLDASGNVIWVTQGTGYNGCDPRGIDIAADGNIYICGYFIGDISFNPLPQPVIGIGDKDPFLAKFNANGLCLWAKVFGSTDWDVAQSVICSSTGDVYVSGVYRGPFTFGGIAVPVYGNYDAFLAKFNTNGDEVWLRPGGGTGNDFTIGLGIGANGDISGTGYFSSTCQFQNSQIQSNGDLDIFSVTYNSAGVQQDIQHWGGTGPDIGWEILTSDNQWFICGSFSNTMQVGTDFLTSSGNTDFFIIGSDISSQSADFAFSTNNLTVDFTLTSAAPDSLRWDFGDGTYSTMTNPQHTYLSYNSFEVTLTAYFPCNTDTASHTVVLCTLPLSAFTYEKDYLFVQFNNSSTMADSVLWQFGDGSVSTQNNPSHLYASAGNYNVNLISFNSCGNDTAVVSIVLCDQMVSDFEFTTQDNLVSFTNLSSGFYDILWDFGDGTTSTLLNPEHEYPGNGDYTVRLYCYSPCDTLVSVDTVTICLLPVPAFTYSFSGDMTYQFINQSTDYLTCMWYFGDGDSSSLQNPVHTYNSSMVFPVQLVLYNNCGSATITDSINLITDIFEITNDPVIVQNNSSGELIVILKEPAGNQDLTLYDLKGRLVYKTQINQSAKLFLNKFTHGVYILKLASKDQITYRKKITFFR